MVIIYILFTILNCTKSKDSEVRSRNNNVISTPNTTLDSDNIYDVNKSSGDISSKDSKVSEGAYIPNIYKPKPNNRVEYIPNSIDLQNNLYGVVRDIKVGSIVNSGDEYISNSIDLKDNPYSCTRDPKLDEIDKMFKIDEVEDEDTLDDNLDEFTSESNSGNRVIIYEKSEEGVNIELEENFLKSGNMRTRVVSFAGEHTQANTRRLSMSHLAWHRNSAILKKRGISLVKNGDLISLINFLPTSYQSVYGKINSILKTGDISPRGAVGETVLMLLATNSRYLGLFKKVVRRAINDVDLNNLIYDKDNFGRNVLHIIVKFNNFKAFYFLKEINANIDELNVRSTYDTDLPLPIDQASIESRSDWEKALEGFNN